MSETQAEYKGTKEVQKREDVLDIMTKKVHALQTAGEIHFPPDYSPQNALKSAWLAIQEAKDKDKKPALEVCTKVSVYNSLMDMVITGLNPAKKQGYFLVYGNQLVFQRSYFGSEALAKRVDPEIAEIVAEPVYEGDEFEFEIVRGKKQVVKHKQTIESINSKKVKAGYCMVIGHNGDVKKTEIMTFDEIKKAWAKSKMNPIGQDGKVKAGSTHDDFMAEMVRKTVINRTCKTIFNSSDDKYLRMATRRSEVIEAEEEAQEEIDANANGAFIDIEPEPEKTSSPPQAGGEPNQPSSAPPKEEKKGNNGGGTAWLQCPQVIDSGRPKKPLEACHKCRNNTQCDPYAEIMSSPKSAVASPEF